MAYPYASTRQSQGHPLAFRKMKTVTDYNKIFVIPPSPALHPHHPPLAIVQWNRLLSRIAMLPDVESFRLAVSSLGPEALFLTFYLSTLSSSDFQQFKIPFSFISPSPVLSFLFLTVPCTEPLFEAQQTPAHYPREGCCSIRKEKKMWPYLSKNWNHIWVWTTRPLGENLR